MLKISRIVGGFGEVQMQKIEKMPSLRPFAMAPPAQSARWWPTFWKSGNCRHHSVVLVAVFFALLIVQINALDEVSRGEVGNFPKENLQCFEEKIEKRKMKSTKTFCAVNLENSINICSLNKYILNKRLMNSMNYFYRIYFENIFYYSFVFTIIL